MRVQQLLTLSSLILAGSLALAAELDHDDIPDTCYAACDPVVRVAQRCDRQNHVDSAEMDCICQSDQARTRIPHCEACIAQYRRDNPNDEDYDGSDETDDETDDGDDEDIDPHDNGAQSLYATPAFNEC